jgi:putative DNA primase/helicase
VKQGEYVSIAKNIEAIATKEKLPIYSHGEALCRPVTDQRKRHDNQIVTVAVLRSYTSASLRRAIDPAIGFRKFDRRRRKYVLCEPPDDIISMVLAGDQKQIFPPLRGIIGTPILRPDRTIITTAGYDAETGYYLVDPPLMPPIPPAPTEKDARRALAIIEDLISEFPFVDGVSKSVALSGLITPLVRAACDVVPGHFFTSPKMGSGKSLLVDLASAIATGERAYAILAHRLPEEQDKQLAAAVLEARQIIALDNLTGEIASSVLAQVTERERLSVRPLGKSTNVAVLNSFNTYLTGNNATVAGDNARRLLVGRIDPQVENPLDRTFQKQNPVITVLGARGEFVYACLIVVLAYIAQGRPCPLTPTLSYEAWSELVREPLVWLGQTDPTDSMRESFRDDPDTINLTALMAAWPTTQTDWTCTELIAAATALDPQTYDPVHPGLVDALKPIARDRRGHLDTGVLGNYLRTHRDKIVGGRKITRSPTTAHGGATRWILA